MLECLVLLMNLIEQLNMMIFFGLYLLLLNSLIEHQIGIAAPLEHSTLWIFLIEFIFLLAPKALFLEIPDVKLFDCGVIELIPLTIVWRLLVSLFDVAVVVASVSRA